MRQRSLALPLCRPSKEQAMNRSSLLILIGILVIVAVGASYLYYQERQTGIDIQIDGQGIKIEGN
jgi:hypothetical protein